MASAFHNVIGAVRRGGALTPAMAANPQVGQPGPQGAPGPAGTPKRIERYTGTSDATGAGTVTFSPAFSAPPVVEPSITWNGAQMVVASASNVTATGCTITVMRSKGTLVLTSGPFELAPNTAFRVLALGS